MQIESSGSRRLLPGFLPSFHATSDSVGPVFFLPSFTEFIFLANKTAGPFFLVFGRISWKISSFPLETANGRGVTTRNGAYRVFLYRVLSDWPVSPRDDDARRPRGVGPSGYRVFTEFLPSFCVFFFRPNSRSWPHFLFFFFNAETKRRNDTKKERERENGREVKLKTRNRWSSPPSWFFFCCRCCLSASSVRSSRPSSSSPYSCRSSLS